MNDVRRLKDQQRDKHPGFDSYMNCMTRSMFTGLAAFCLSFSSCYFVQKICIRKLSYPLKYNVLLSSLVASGVSYKITSDRTKSCQAAWMAAENKHSILRENDF